MSNYHLLAIALLNEIDERGGMTEKQIHDDFPYADELIEDLRTVGYIVEAEDVDEVKINPTVWIVAT